MDGIGIGTAVFPLDSYSLPLVLLPMGFPSSSYSYSSDYFVDFFEEDAEEDFVGAAGGPFLAGSDLPSGSYSGYEAFFPFGSAGSFPFGSAGSFPFGSAGSFSFGSIGSFPLASAGSFSEGGVDFTGIALAGAVFGADLGSGSGSYSGSLAVAFPFGSAGCLLVAYFSLCGAGFSADFGGFLVGAVLGSGSSSGSSSVFFAFGYGPCEFVAFLF